MTQAPPLRLGDLLVSRGIITQDQLAITLREQRETQQPLGEMLVKLGFVTSEKIRDTLAFNIGTDTVDLKGVVPFPEALALVPKNLAARCNAFPVVLNEDTNVLTVALSDTHDVVAIDLLRRHLGNENKLVFKLASKTEIIDAINRCYGHELTIDGILKELEGGGIDYAGLTASGENYAHPIVRLVNTLLADAVLRESSDIHFEPEGPMLRIRYRIDGVLRTIRVLHITFWAALLTRLKVLAGMDIAEMRAPQDGRISLQIAGRTVDFRCASQPTVHGENYVLRILDKKQALVSIDYLGLPPNRLKLLKLMLERPEGILLVTGPTGSGKTTTLYSLLGYMNDEGVNIMTLEDPVEYVLPMVRQTQVGEATKIDFASGIRSLMRQDPDIILVGEIRDESTAEMAFRAAMTGHMVLSTLHTNSAIRAIPRLKDIGIKPDVMAGNIIGIIAQRLIRKLCICAENDTPSEKELALFHSISIGVEWVKRPKGCPRCSHTGYKGRMSIMEVLRCDKDIDELIGIGSSTTKIEQAAIDAGYEPMAIDGIRRVAEGLTTVEEVGRVVDLTDWLMKLGKNI
jgi:type II secretory ATPase GspE/PulE/Tfp pilus assembly ATPase PilB-like protein